MAYTVFRWQFVYIFIQIFLVGSEKRLCLSDVSVPIDSAYATSY